MRRSNISLRLFLVCLALLLYCEYLVYFVVLRQCSWPSLPAKPSVRALVIADVHLLGNRYGHWFDRLRREWQMYRAFQTLLALHQPDVVFVLGDLFDEGLWASTTEFENYVARFHSMFDVGKKTVLYVVAGNHDIGFHYYASPQLVSRFSRAFASPAVRQIVLGENVFVLINSIALEGDGCDFCTEALHSLQNLSESLKCNLGACRSRPIILQHFPMYRESDSVCQGPALDPRPTTIFRPKWECLSQESTDLVMNLLKPRLVITGHTHHGCFRIHRNEIPEITVASFSWRNRDNPYALLGTLSPTEHNVSLCALPRESTVILIYTVGGAAGLIWALLSSSARRKKNHRTPPSLDLYSLFWA